MPDRRAEVVGKWHWRGCPFGGDQAIVFDGKGRWESRAIGDLGGFGGRWSLKESTLSIWVNVIDVMPGDVNGWRFDLGADGRRLASVDGKGGTLTKEPPRSKR